MLVPEGILGYFELSKVARTRTGLHIYRVEKNEPPIDCKDQKMESKGFLPEIAIQDFPIRNQHVTLFIKRRRWEVKETGAIISLDWHLVRQGTRMTKGFAAFLSGRRSERIVSITTPSVTFK
ncbi:ISAon1 family transposase N-terminal region protein [Larkinella harenae]